MVVGKERYDMTKQVTKGEQLFDAGCLMLTLVVDARPETNSEVVVFESNTPGELVVIITNGAQHRYISIAPVRECTSSCHPNFIIFSHD